MIEKDIEHIRQKVSDFCLKYCDAKCCHTGSIVLTSPEEMQLMGVNASKGKFYAPVDVSKGCPKLVKNRCSIYQHRPRLCQEFPIFCRGKTIVVAQWCSAIHQITPDLEELEEKGMRIILQ